MNQISKVAIITGAGSGIGKAVALALLADGFQVVLAGRRTEPLNQVAQQSGAAQRALSDWCADRQPAAAGHPVDLLKPALVDAARAMMGSAPASVDWGMLGAALAMGLPTLALPLRLGLQDAVSCDSLWGMVVQAIWQADGPDVLDTIRLTLAGHLSPEAAVPAWVSQAMAGAAGGRCTAPGWPPPLVRRPWVFRRFFFLSFSSWCRRHAGPACPAGLPHLGRPR